jgi:hypothetical protein
MTTREVTPEGLGVKAALELSTHDRMRLGLPGSSQEFTAIRERWATVTNEALKEANIEARVDHRSLAEQGIDREPKPHIPFAAYKIERAGKHSDVAESIRADYNARVQARLERQPQHEPEALTSQAPATSLLPRRDATASPRPGAAAQDPVRTDPQQPRVPAPQSLEDIRREARENWLMLRAQQLGQGRPSATTTDHQPDARQPAAASPTRAIDNDQTL